MNGSEILAVLMGGLALAAAVGIVTASQTIYSALALVVNMVSLAVLFLLLNAQFLFAVQIIVYAGAVMVLFVFIIALLNPGADDQVRMDWRAALGIVAVIGTPIALLLMARNGVTYNTSTGVLHGQTVGSQSDPYHSFAFAPAVVNQAGNVQTTAGQLFTTFVLPFEITSLLLFVAAIGAVYFTRKGSHEKTHAIR